MAEIKLKECPCCGGKAAFGSYLTSEYVYCTVCGIMTKCFGATDYMELNRISAAEAWNKREGGVKNAG